MPINQTKSLRRIVTSLVMITSTSLWADNPEPILYGTVTLNNNTSHTGSLRWGDQETFLSDIFNGRKADTVGIEHLTEDEKEVLLDHQPGPKANIGDLQITFKSFFGKEIDPPYFNVQFGSIQRIDIKDDEVLATLHDGTVIKTDFGNNDTSDEVQVMDNERVTSDHDFDDIKSIEFTTAPENAKTFGDGIYGTIQSSMGTFQGRVMWDKDERLTTEKLDGNDESGQEQSIEFHRIQSITKGDDPNESRVVLNDGQVMVLSGTNDVNRGNRGIWLDHPDHGRIEIDWWQFEQLTIEDTEVAWRQFSDYQSAAKPLKGVVELTDGKTIQAERITFDMNQQSNTELLYADMAGNNRQLPLFLVSSMLKTEAGIELVLSSGEKLLAYNNRSVTRENNGMVVNDGQSNQYLTWEQVKSVRFQ